MSQLIVNQTITENNQTVYAFTSRGTDYTVIAGYGFNNDEFAVYSDRKNHSSRTPATVMSLKEMSKRSKALGHLAAIIAA